MSYMAMHRREFMGGAAAVVAVGAVEGCAEGWTAKYVFDIELPEKEVYKPIHDRILKNLALTDENQMEKFIFGYDAKTGGQTNMRGTLMNNYVQFYANSGYKGELQKAVQKQYPGKFTFIQTSDRELIKKREEILSDPKLKVGLLKFCANLPNQPNWFLTHLYFAQPGVPKRLEYSQGTDAQRRDQYTKADEWIRREIQSGSFENVAKIADMISIDGGYELHQNLGYIPHKPRVWIKK